jgi:hypothetical protein
VGDPDQEGDAVTKPPCDTFADSGNRYTACGPDPKYGNVCATCGWSQSSHTEETRAIARGEHPESVSDGQGGFYRQPKWGSPHAKPDRWS